MFPLWHGKVATFIDGFAILKKDLFPLWHGKVATSPDAT